MRAVAVARVVLLAVAGLFVVPWLVAGAVWALVWTAGKVFGGGSDFSSTMMHVGGADVPTWVVVPVVGGAALVLIRDRYVRRRR